MKLSTKTGAKKFLICCMIIALLASCLAQLLSTDFGRVKVSHLVIDKHGATFEADIYIPAGTKDTDSLPSIIVTHGRGAHFGQERGFSEELSRRGYVVINTAAYGTATSEMPFIDASGQGENNYFIDDSDQGVFDALEYLRTLGYVDTSRIGILGHSSGSRKAGFTAIKDCGYFTFNDVMLNVLHDQFGVEITEEQLTQNADDIAAVELTQDLQEYYNYIRTEKEAEYGERVRSVVLIGSDANKVGPTAQVTVAGHEVTRSCKVNFCIIDGGWDFGYINYPTRDTTKAAWYNGDQNVAEGMWYVLDDNTGTSAQLGAFNSTRSAELAKAIDEQTTRLFIVSENESHAKNVLSVQTNSAAIEYFDLTLGHDSGISSRSTTFVFRVILNGIALFAMLGMVLALAALLAIRTEEVGKYKLSVPVNAPVTKRNYIIGALLTTVLTFYSIYRANAGNYSPFAARPLANIFRLIVTGRNISIFIVYIGVASAIMLIYQAITNKKASGKIGLNCNVKVRFGYIMKALGQAILVIAFCYTTLLIIRYLFNQDYRLWISGYTDMKVEYWGIVAAYAMLFLPCFLLNSVSINSTIRTDIPEWKDDLLCVLINSAGLWLCCLVNIISMSAFGKGFSLFTCTYDMVLLLPVLTYFTRKFYRMTKSVWFGAFLNSLLVAWNLVSSTGINDRFYAIGFFSRFFNI